jgi:hypothetical protein
MCQIATIDSLASIQMDGYAKHYSTLSEYLEAQVSDQENRASQQIDADRQPYLIDEDAVNMGSNPYIPIYDLVEGQENLIGVSTPQDDVYLQPNTLLAWKA